VEGTARVRAIQIFVAKNNILWWIVLMRFFACFWSKNQKLKAFYGLG
jgi:hypothetical protein